MANHAVVRLDKVQALKVGNIVSAVYTSDIDNGSVVTINTLDSSNDELFNVGASSTPTTDDLLLVCSPEVQGVMYTPGKTLKDFYNEANKPFRAVYLTEGDIVTITDNGITGATTVGQYVVPSSGTVTLAAAANLSGSTKLAFKVIKKLTAATAFSYTGSSFDKETASVLLVVKA